MAQNTQHIEISEQFDLVFQFISQTNQSLFLTGKAGTGKTTLLKYIKTNCFKNMAIVAPTGVAAINAGGVTIHSFFQLPLNPFVPSNPSQLLETLKYNKERLNIIRQLETLIIDEISMVRADVIDAIDVILRNVRRKYYQPFGGVQILFIGDMYQLPPVVREPEWRILSDFYKSPFFFDSQVLQQNPVVIVELEKIYRQKAKHFVNLLNKVRNNEMDYDDLEALNAKFQSEIPDETLQNNIILSTHNAKVDEINNTALNKIDEVIYFYNAEIKGNFSDRNFPVEEILKLKMGARVMFLKNDTEKRYYNGKIGTVTHLDSEKILVRCDGENFDIDVPKESWENVNYKLNNESQKIEEEKLGEFIQYPLRLAWAITIHKSQGLTFDNLIIDASESFSAGQVYVALSRCTNLEGLTLKSKIKIQSLRNDENIVNFSQSKRSEDEIYEILEKEKRTFLSDLIITIFQANYIVLLIENLEKTLAINHNNINYKDTEDWIIPIRTRVLNIQKTAETFKRQLQTICAEDINMETDEFLKERIQKAANYFSIEWAIVFDMYKKCPTHTESKVAFQEINPSLQELFNEIFLKQYFISKCKNGFSFADYTEAKLKILLPSFSINIYKNAVKKYSGKSPHPELMQKLIEVRDEIVEEENKPIFLVAKMDSLIDLTTYLPLTEAHLMKIKGFGKAKVKVYGVRFLSVIKTYCDENNVSTNMENLK